MKKRIFAALLLVLMLSACGSAASPAPTPAPTYDPNTLKLHDFMSGRIIHLNINDTVRLDYTLPGPVTVDNKDVISQDGVQPDIYRAHAVGQAKMQVKYSSCIGIIGGDCGSPEITMTLHIIVS